MPHTDQTYQYVDPRRLDGSPFQVAAAAFEQAANVGELLETAVEDAFVFARNAEMEREIYLGKEPDGVGFPNTPIGRKITSVQTVLAEILGALDVAAKAAAYDPKNPPKED